LTDAEHNGVLGARRKTRSWRRVGYCWRQVSCYCLVLFKSSVLSTHSVKAIVILGTHPHSTFTSSRFRATECMALIYTVGDCEQLFPTLDHPHCVPDKKMLFSMTTFTNVDWFY